jgi:hypothetical protein
MSLGSSSSSTDTLSAEERTDLFNSGNSAVDSGLSSLSDLSYEAPTYVSSGDYSSLADGDYDAYEDSIYSSLTSGLSEYESEARDYTDQDLADRGIWSSGIATAAQNDITDELAEYYSSAASDAATQRYALESADNTALNTYNQTESAAENSFNLDTATSDYASDWAPYEYLMDLWNGTDATVSSSSSFNLGL